MWGSIRLQTDSYCRTGNSVCRVALAQAIFSARLRGFCWPHDAIGYDEWAIFFEFYLASIRYTTSSGFMSNSQSVSASYLRGGSEELRKGFWQQLRGYFIGEDGTDRDKSVKPTAMESEIGEMSEGNGGVEADAGETVTLPEAVEEVESIGGEEAQEVARDVQQSESVMVAATSEGKLEVKSDCCRCVEVMLWKQQRHQVGKVAGEFVFVLPSRSPPYVSSFLFSILCQGVNCWRRN